PGLFPRRLKAFCEISFLEFCVTSRPSPVIREALAEIVSGSLSVSDLLSLTRHNIVHANLFLPILSACLCMGMVTEEQESDIGHLLHLVKRNSKERLPFRQIDLLHGLFCLTGDESLYAELVTIAKSGCLGPIFHCYDANSCDDYAVTHTIFYLTDFGRRRWPDSLTPAPLLESILDQLSWVAEADENLDLLAEYALCRQCLGFAGSRLDHEVGLLLRSWEPGRCWPGPADLSETLAKEL